MKRTITVEIEVEVEFTVSGRHRPAVTHGHADNWAPAEEPEVEIESVSVCTPLRNGTIRKIDILPALSQDAEEAIRDEVFVDACEEQRAKHADAMEREADFRSDR
jgi:hypothetical protein